ncbi:unnamed protein product [Toxocara canis]|uniref:ADF-H domain-containing protein n=1 Tax=Toxocara canis TaxID=6265 RepID=A0A183UAM6_TOXCA|nr:unnamed protein product [Toxocara canis]
MNGSHLIFKESFSESVSNSSFTYSIQLVRNYYIGATTPKRAEDYVHECTSFRIYHALQQTTEETLQKMELAAKESIPGALQLYVVYKTSNGTFCHYKIVDASPPNSLERMFTVDYGDSHAPRFISLYSLVRYYSLYASLHSDCDSDAIQADVFPCWIKDDRCDEISKRALPY